MEQSNTDVSVPRKPTFIDTYFWDCENLGLSKRHAAAKAVAALRKFTQDQGGTPGKLYATGSFDYLNKDLKKDLSKIKQVTVTDVKRYGHKDESDYAIMKQIKEFRASKAKIGLRRRLVIITGDSDFVPTIETLRACCYDVVLFHSNHTPDELLATATQCYEWKPFLKLEGVNPPLSFDRSTGQRTGGPRPKQIQYPHPKRKIEEIIEIDHVQELNSLRAQIAEKRVVENKDVKSQN